MTLDEMETKVFLAMMSVREIRGVLNAAGEYERAGLLADAEDRLVKVHDRLFDEKMAARRSRSAAQGGGEAP